MKKILLTLCTGVCLSGAALAQEPTKAVAKKSIANFSVASTSPKDENAEMAERVKAKQKHYAELQAAAKTTPEADAKVNALNGSRKKKIAN